MNKSQKTIVSNWRQEVKAAQTYEILAGLEPNTGRKELFQELAQMERKHAEMWRVRMAELGIDTPPEPSPTRARLYGMLSRLFGSTAALVRIERDERGHARKFANQAIQTQGRDTALLTEIAHDEKELARRLRTAVAASRERSELDSLLKRESWHVKSSNWVADAIYGANDGLGAVFGIVSGMSGYSGGSKLVLVAGLAGMLASALSMGSSAYLAAKSEREVIDAEMGRERKEIEEDPEEEQRELELFYRLKGFTKEEAAILVDRISKSPEDMLKTLAHEELGISHASAPNPWVSMVSAALSTAVGASVPLVPFFFFTGVQALVIALVISLLAHFFVGVLKSLLTTRNWLASGLEMTIVGVIVSAATYLLGRLLSPTGLT